MKLKFTGVGEQPYVEVRSLRAWMLEQEKSCLKEIDKAHNGRHQIKSMVERIESFHQGEIAMMQQLRRMLR